MPYLQYAWRCCPRYDAWNIYLYSVTRSVVACKDFTTPSTVVMDFASVKNQIIDSSSNGYGTELDDVLETIQKQSVVDPKELSDRFWDMFIIDAFIGNWDRHNGNWGFLYNAEDDTMRIAPIYDCGSSLYPQADEKIMTTIMTNPNERKYRIYERPTSAITQNGKKLNYFTFISSLSNRDCNEA